ncbi:4-coumarate--CoA ligase 1 isoform X2 [Cephus cinctus]|uniref:Luciferin 4-monooxygenase n=1 Tax=Cephus cinctus TaxID=211228 RepID=A0AAJ7VYG7_CEPCN|nr:4-coumarate--CoA ligase 1 isoform X2 [Cephus cinctus]
MKKCSYVQNTTFRYQFESRIKDYLFASHPIGSPGNLPLSTSTLSEYVWKDVEKFANKIALECGETGRKYTYAQARDSSNYVARSLRNIGLKVGDVVAVILPNLPETAVAFLGASEAGLIVTTVNFQYTVYEISKQLIDCNARAVITAAEIAPTVLAAIGNSNLGKIPVVVVDDGVQPIPTGTIPFQDLITKGKSLPSLPERTWSDEDVAALPYSSGTTGLPKGVMLTHRNLVRNIMMVRNTVPEGIFWNKATDSFQEVIPSVLPLFHIYGMNAIMCTRLSIGSRLVTLPKFTPELFASVLAKYKTTTLLCAPPIILFLTASPLIKPNYLDHVQCVISGAAPLGKSDVDRFYEKFQSLRSTLHFGNGYGLTETSPVALFNWREDKYGSIGEVLCGSSIRLVDPITNVDISEPGKSGELLIKGPHVMKGYYKNEAATKETIIEGGWLKTGDIAYFDEDFDFYISDRLKELIKVKGFQVPPAEIEELLRTHKDIEEAAVIGIPDSRYGEVPKAFVLPKSGRKPSEEDIKNFVNTRVAEYKHLRGGVTLVDSIPKNPSGKILRIKLRDKYVN